MFIKLFIFMVHYMLSVGFFMYIERKFLGLSHYREGPNKVFMKGYFQFLYDMIKLLTKSWFELFNFMFVTYFFIPYIMLLNIIMMWILLPFNSLIINKDFSIIYLIVLMIMKMFYLILMVFFIYSIYSYMSIVRMVIQVVSYDVVLILVFIFVMLMYVDVDFNMVLINFNYCNMFNCYLFLFWLFSIMVELIRLPFDFYEGESELISGFNVEYSSFMFLILVLVEYMEMIYFIFVTVLLFINFNMYSLSFSMILFIMIFFLIWLRVFFVRYRMDKMLIVLWKFIFPFMMLMIFFYYIFNFF